MTSLNGAAMTASFSTAAVERRSQLDYWREVVCATFVRLGVERIGAERARRPAGFRGEVTAQDVGGLQVATVVSEPHAVFRSPTMIRRSPEDDVMVNLAVRGPACVAQGGREAVLRPGDFTVHDSARPCRIACPEPFTLVVLKMPRDLFAACCPLPPGATATAIPGDRGAGALFASVLRGLPARVGGVPAGAAEQAGIDVLELLGAVLSDLAGGAGRAAVPRRAQLLRARRFITSNLSDPDLSPAAVAEALGLSVRYLYLIFHEQSTSPFRWILDRRLERAAALLADPGQAGRSITGVAFGVGFKDSSHFSRAFKDRYGVGPRDYRRRLGNGAPSNRGACSAAGG
jgi:AraC-like DNA-binding protein